MDKETIQKARKTNLVEYLLSRGEQLEKNGTRYRHKIHNSLVFTDNMFYWNSRSISGNAIDFLMLYYNMDFITAVTELTGKVQKNTSEENSNFNFNNVKICNNQKRSIAYLCKTRKVSYKLVSSLINQGLIYQEEKTNNIIFPMRNKEKEIVGIEYNGTMSDIKFKGIGKGSFYGYGYNIVFNTPKNIIFFESAIDLISFIDIRKRQNINIKNMLLVSMAGLKLNVVKKMLEEYSIKNPPIFCVDNDNAGKNFIEKTKKAYPDLKYYFPQKGKDWNEYLKLF